MYPELFPNVGSYSFFVSLGVVAALLIFRLLSTPYKLSDKAFVTFGLMLAGSIIIGFVFAWLFQGFYRFIDTGEWNLISVGADGHIELGGITFMGGLVGGTVAFIALSLIFVRRDLKNQMWNMICLAPIALAAGHSLGRIGCLLGGCCYGKITDSIFGMDLKVDKITPPRTLPYMRFPTQLYESIFLALLCVAMFIVVLRFKKYGLPPVVYLFSYSVFRFLLEFLRDDYRGGAGFLSPSQWQSIVMLIGGIILAVYMFKFKRVPFNKKVDKPSEFLFDYRQNKAKEG